MPKRTIFKKIIHEYDSSRHTIMNDLDLRVELILRHIR